MLTRQNVSKEYDTCDYRYFKDNDFKEEPYLCNGCHSLMQKAMNFDDVSIVLVKRNDYRIYYWYMSKDDAMNIMKSSNLN